MLARRITKLEAALNQSKVELTLLCLQEQANGSFLDPKTGCFWKSVEEAERACEPRKAFIIVYPKTLLTKESEK